MPWAPGHEAENDPVYRAISVAAADLNRLRQNWLDPKEWMSQEVLEFQASRRGPWGGMVKDAGDVGTARYSRTTCAKPEFTKELAKRTLTALYNAMPRWLVDAHAALDEAVFKAYAEVTSDRSWSPSLPGEEILSKLVLLNLARSTISKSARR